MTISYQRDVASSTAGGFTRLLFKWKGSLYKLIFRELLLFLTAYILLSLIYRQILTIHQRSLFEMVVKYFDAFINLIPLSFVLGFYVSYVATRWWQQFLAIPWPDKLFHSIACFVDGFSEESRMLRRSLMRYMNLAFILVLRSISSAVKQRFPTLDHVVESGFMTIQEKELFCAVPSQEFNTYWIPCTWFIFRLQEAAKNGKLINEYAIETLMREFGEFRSKCGLLWCYDWVSIPMVYTQVVTLATYVFFIFTVIGRQKIDTLKKGEYMRSGRMPLDLDLYIPVYTVLQFFFYMGLLKVAEQLINPFGDDDEDFELNWLIDRHMKASFLGCDILMDPDRIPPMVKDYYWDKQNCPIPYTEASMQFKRKTYRGSADDMIVPENKQHMILPEIEEEDEDRSSIDTNKNFSKLSLTSLLLDSTNLITGPSFVELSSHSPHRRVVNRPVDMLDGAASRKMISPGLQQYMLPTTFEMQGANRQQQQQQPQMMMLNQTPWNNHSTHQQSLQKQPDVMVNGNPASRTNHLLKKMLSPDFHDEIGPTLRHPHPQSFESNFVNASLNSQQFDLQGGRGGGEFPLQNVIIPGAWRDNNTQGGPGKTTLFDESNDLNTRPDMILLRKFRPSSSPAPSHPPSQHHRRRRPSAHDVTCFEPSGSPLPNRCTPPPTSMIGSSDALADADQSPSTTHKRYQRQSDSAVSRNSVDYSSPQTVLDVDEMYL